MCQRSNSCASHVWCLRVARKILLPKANRSLFSFGAFMPIYFALISPPSRVHVFLNSATFIYILIFHSLPYYTGPEVVFVASSS